ncbi:hypothetical protein ACCT25_33710, partial [Rhizobium ruizarguesonis]
RFYGMETWRPACCSMVKLLTPEEVDNRRDDGSRSFKLIEGAPLRTSFGEDLYKVIFATSAGGAQQLPG